MFLLDSEQRADVIVNSPSRRTRAEFDSIRQSWGTVRSTRSDVRHGLKQICHSLGAYRP